MASKISISTIQTGVVTPVKARALPPATFFRTSSVANDRPAELFCTPGNNLGDNPHPGYMFAIRVQTMEVTDFALDDFVTPCDTSVLAFDSPGAGG